MILTFFVSCTTNCFDMRTSEIIKEIQKLPIPKRFLIVEKTIHSIRTSEDKNLMKKAAEVLYTDYKTDNELTAFSSLDFLDFYEAK